MAGVHGPPAPKHDRPGSRLRLQRAVPRVVYGLAVILATAMAVALAFVLSGGLGVSVAGGLTVGLVFGLASVVAAAFRRNPESSRRGLVSGLLLGLAGAVAVGLSAEYVNTGKAVAVALGYAGVVATGTTVGLRRQPGQWRVVRWRFGSGLVTGILLGFAGGAGVLLGGLLAVGLGVRLTGSAGLSLLAGLAFAGGLAGVFAAGAAVVRRRPSVSSRGMPGRREIGTRVPGLMLGIVLGLAASLILALPVVVIGLPGMIGVGLAIARRRHPEPSSGVRWRPSISGLAAALAIGFAGLAIGLAASFAAGLAVGLAALLVFGFAGGLEGVPRDLNTAASARIVLAHDRRAALVNGLAGLLTVGLAAGITTAIIAGSGLTQSRALAAKLSAGLVYGLTAGIVAGIVFGLASSTLNTAWPSYQLARAWLTMRRRLPLLLMAFLDDAHKRGVLRQAGAVYEFRHIELQHRLANRPQRPGGAV